MAGMCNVKISQPKQTDAKRCGSVYLGVVGIYVIMSKFQVGVQPYKVTEVLVVSFRGLNLWIGNA